MISLTYDEGSAPKLSNEIAVSKKMSEKKDWHVGDTIETNLHDGKHSFIITGLYTDYMQVGESARMNPSFDLSKEMLADYWNIAVHTETDLSQKELAAELAKELPAYEWNSAQDVVDRNVGGIQKMLESMKIPMTALLCAIIMLITLLMEKLFIVREKGEIAMLKSVGVQRPQHSVLAGGPYGQCDRLLYDCRNPAVPSQQPICAETDLCHYGR